MSERQKSVNGHLFLPSAARARVTAGGQLHHQYTASQRRARSGRFTAALATIPVPITEAGQSGGIRSRIESLEALMLVICLAEQVPHHATDR